MIEDKNRIYDGFVTLESGVDSGRAPNLIDTNQAASAENMVFGGGGGANSSGLPRGGTYHPLTGAFGCSAPGISDIASYFEGGPTVPVGNVFFLHSFRGGGGPTNVKYL